MAWLWLVLLGAAFMLKPHEELRIDFVLASVGPRTRRVLGILASMIVMWFSRQREFRADAGGANLAGRNKMIAALEKLKINHEQATLPEQMAAFGIASGGGLAKLFSTHPSLDTSLPTAYTPLHNYRFYYRITVINEIVVGLID